MAKCLEDSLPFIGMIHIQVTKRSQMHLVNHENHLVRIQTSDLETIQFVICLSLYKNCHQMRTINKLDLDWFLQNPIMTLNCSAT